MPTEDNFIDEYIYRLENSKVEHEAFDLGVFDEDLPVVDVVVVLVFDTEDDDDTYENFDSEDWEFYEESERKADYKWELIAELDRTHDGLATSFHSMLFFNLYNACCKFYNVDHLDFN